MPPGKRSQSNTRDINSACVSRIRPLIAAAALSLVAGALTRAQAPARPDRFVGGPDALALIQTLNAELLRSRSATQTLEQWCGDHRIAAEPTIVAKLIRRVEKAPTAEQRQRLQIAGAEVKYRRVRLECGSHVLSEADNWYVPSRLTAEMNRMLETTGTPFGTVVRPLEPTRQTLTVTMLWTGGLPVPDALFAHRALLFTREHVPFSEVYEVYQRGILEFTPP